ncbi:thrombopoietin [Calonectris borealis]|uniref:thrombopoietin n=1 Tax=Calonectris borealis TaxID=1323832 RepID=UPI003F4BE8F4
MQGRSPQLSMELNRLLLLTSFLLHVEEGRASPTRLVCDNRLIQKYIGEAKDMEKKAGQCQALPALSCPTVLPLVDFSLQQWKSKSVRGAGRMVLALGHPRGWRRSPRVGTGTRMLNKMPVGIPGGTGGWKTPSRPRVDRGINQARGGGGQPTHCLLPQNETKRREILCDLALLVGAVAAAQGQVTQECGARQLSQLYQHTNSFLLLLQTFSWEVRPPPREPGHPGAGASCAGLGMTALSPPCPTLAPQAGPWEPGCSPRSMEQTHITSIFLTYRQLVQGKLRFFFHDLAKDLCKQGQGNGRVPQSGAR